MTESVAENLVEEERMALCENAAIGYWRRTYRAIGLLGDTSRSWEVTVHI